MKVKFVHTVLPFFFIFPFFQLAAQTSTVSSRECRISSGFGISEPSHNSSGTGTDFWLQLSYNVLGNFALATEFENMYYHPSGKYFSSRTQQLHINIYDNNFSLLIKYNFPPVKKIRFALASGWTYCTRQKTYELLTKTDTSLTSSTSVETYNDNRIPFLGEIEYPVFSNLNIQARIKYNFNPQNGSAYAAAAGLSLKL